MNSEKFGYELMVKFFAYSRELVGKDTIKLKLKDKITTVRESKKDYYGDVPFAFIHE